MRRTKGRLSLHLQRRTNAAGILVLAVIDQFALVIRGEIVKASTLRRGGGQHFELVRREAARLLGFV
jgi:hypothetical protein